jgi:hypothetical protein
MHGQKGPTFFYIQLSKKEKDLTRSTSAASLCPSALPFEETGWSESRGSRCLDFQRLPWLPPWSSPALQYMAFTFCRSKKERWVDAESRKEWEACSVY